MNFQEFLEKNLKIELGIKNLPQEIQNETIAQFTENLLKKIMTKIFVLLPADKKDEFLRLQEQESEKIESFLNAHIPNFDKIMAETIESAKEEYREIVENLIEQEIKSKK